MVSRKKKEKKKRKAIVASYQIAHRLHVRKGSKRVDVINGGGEGGKGSRLVHVSLVL
jgi:hypothetical protein